jgi:hypothetical protein
MDAAGSLSEITAHLYQTISPVLLMTIVISTFTAKSHKGRRFQPVDLPTVFLKLLSLLFGSIPFPVLCADMKSGNRMLNWNFNLDFESRLWYECFCQAVQEKKEVGNSHSA